jgi:hypothetical protein
MLVVFVLNSRLTPPDRKSRKLFSIVSGADMAKLSIRAKYTSGAENSDPAGEKN